MSESMRHPLLRRENALLALALALAAGMMVLGNVFPMLVAIVTLGAWYGGWRMGMGVTAGFLAFALARGAWTTHAFTPTEAVDLINFTVLALLINGLTNSLQGARRRAEANQGWLAAVLTSIGDAVIVTDRHGRVSFMNPVARSLTGWGEDEAVEQPLESIFRIVSEGTRQPAENPASRVLREGVVVGLANHTLLIARDGTERPIDDSAAPVKDRKADIAGVVLVFRDVTERKRAEQSLMESARLAALGADIGAAVGGDYEVQVALQGCAEALVQHLGAAGACIWVLDEADKMLELQGVVGLNALPGSPQGRVPVGNGDIGRIVQRRQPLPLDGSLGDPRLDDQVWVDRGGMAGSAGYPLIAEGKVVGALAVFSRHRIQGHAADALAAAAERVALYIERRRAEAVMRDSETRYRLLFETNPHPMWVFDVETLAFLAVNEAAVVHYGYSRDEFLAMTIVDIRPPEDERAVREAVASRRGAAVVNSAGWRHRKKDGTVIDVEVTSTTVEFAGRRARVVLANDVSDRRRIEAALVRAKEAAELANGAKDRFLAVLSHELRTPLTPVLFATTALLDDSSLPPAARTALEMIRRNVELEARLIDDLLDVTSIARGRLHLDLRVVEAHESIREAVSICRAEIDAGGIDLTLDLVAAEHHVRADPARLQQVFWNLVKNATKFTPPGGTIAIRTRNRVAADDGPGVGLLVVEVSDTGMGIEPELLPRIFEAFEQGQTAPSRRAEGLGLGLAIGRSLAEAHGGRLTAASPGPGQGTTFTLDLPTVSTPNVYDGSPSVTPVERPRGEALRILLLEDNKDTLRYISLVLGLRHHRVKTAERVSEAREAAAAEEFDLLISDIELPDGTGLDLMRQIGGGRRTLGIAMSGYGSEEDIQQSKAAGFAEHLVKPIDVRRLEEAIHRVASLRGRVETGQGPV